MPTKQLVEADGTQTTQKGTNGAAHVHHAGAALIEDSDHSYTRAIPDCISRYFSAAVSGAVDIATGKHHLIALCNSATTSNTIVIADAGGGNAVTYEVAAGISYDLRGKRMPSGIRVVSSDAGFELLYRIGDY